MRKLLFITFFCICVLQSKGQVFYTSCYEFVNGFGHAVLYKVAITPNGVTHTRMNTCADQNFFSLAATDKYLYWLDNAYLFRGDLQGDNLVNCQPICPVAQLSNNLTIGPDGWLYYWNDHLYATNPDTHVTIDKGKEPYGATGDISFYEDKLYMAGDGLISIDINNPAQAFVYIPYTIVNTFGLVSVATNPHKNTMYILASPSGIDTEIWEVDMDNRKIKSKVGSLPISALDAASPSENGKISGIEIKEIKTTPYCTDVRYGDAEIVTKLHTGDFTYKLNTGETNTTGKFLHLTPGNYHVTITADVETVETDFTMPVYTLVKPVYAHTIKNQNCDTPGKITFTTADAANKKFMVANGTATYPIDHVFNDLAAGIHHFTFINEYGCEVDNTDLEVKRDKCTIKFDKVLTTKECKSITNSTVTVLTLPHTDTYTYKLNGETNATGVFNMVPPGNYTLNIQSPDDQKDIPVGLSNYSENKPVFTVTASSPVCDTAGIIQFNTAINPGNYIVYKDGVSYPLRHQFTGLTEGTYHFTFTDAQGCLLNEQDVNLQRNKCTIKFDRTDVQQQCDAIHKGIIAVISKSHYGQYSYTLNGVSNTTGIFNNLNAGKYSIKINSAEDELIIEAQVSDYSVADPIVNINKQDPACAAKGKIQLVIANSSNYQVMYNGVIYPANHQFTNLDAGAYQFTVLKNSCLVNNYSATLQYQPCPIVINNVDVKPECDVMGKGLIQVACSPIPETYTYLLDGNSNSTGVFNMLNPGTYQLKVSASGGGIPQVRRVTIPDYTADRPFIVLNRKHPVCEIAGTIQLEITGKESSYQVRYKGQVYPASHMFSGLFEGSYHFEILKLDGCIIDETDVDLVREICSPVSFPSAFTPNGDGINDVFRADPTSKALQYRFQIFDRFGALVFTTTDLQSAWDGQYRGRMAPSGTYYWVATFINQENKPVTLKGFVALIR